MGTPFTLHVKRNDEITVAEIAKFGYERILVSPGPGEPADPAYFGVCSEVLQGPAKELPVLGVCLGMQGLAHVLRRGKSSGRRCRCMERLHRSGTTARASLPDFPDRLNVMRYHSLIVERGSLPDCFEITAETLEDDETTREIMGLRHLEFPRLEGIQFHPESVRNRSGNADDREFSGSQPGRLTFRESLAII